MTSAERATACMEGVPHYDGARWERIRQAIADAIDAACDEIVHSRDHEIGRLMREIEALKEKIEDMRHDATERGER